MNASDFHNLLKSSSIDSYDPRIKTSLEDDPQLWLNAEIKCKVETISRILTKLNNVSDETRSDLIELLALFYKIDSPSNREEYIQVLSQNLTSAASAGTQMNLLECFSLITEESDPHCYYSVFLSLAAPFCSTNYPLQIRSHALKTCVYSVNNCEPHDIDQSSFSKLVQEICQIASEATENDFRLSAYKHLVSLGHCNFSLLSRSTFKDSIVEVTAKGMQKASLEEIITESLEFWTTVCEEEKDAYMKTLGPDLVVKALPEEQGFLRKYGVQIVPLVIDHLFNYPSTTSYEDATEVADLNSLGMIFFVSLSKFTEFAVLEYLSAAIIRNIQPESPWQNRQTAISLLASVSEACPSNFFSPFKDIFFNILQESDNKELKHTTAWAYQYIFENHYHDPLPMFDLMKLIEFFIKNIKDDGLAPMYATAVTTIYSNAKFEYSGREQKMAYETICNTLLSYCDKYDTNARDFTTVAISFSDFLQKPPVLQVDLEIIKKILTCINVKFNQLNQALSETTVLSEKNDIWLNEANYSTILSQVLMVDEFFSPEISAAVLTMIPTLLNVLEGVTMEIKEEEAESIISGVCSIIPVLDADFDRFLPTFYPPLLRMLKGKISIAIKSLLVGVIGDICRVCPSFFNYANETMTVLFSFLDQPIATTEFFRMRDHVLRGFGDVALCLNDDFNSFVPSVLTVLIDNSKTKPPAKFDSNEAQEYYTELYSAIVDALTGIIMGDPGPHSQKSVLKKMPEITLCIRQMVTHVCGDLSCENLCDQILGLIGDLISTLGDEVKRHFDKPWVKKFANEASSSQELKDRCFFS